MKLDLPHKILSPPTLEYNIFWTYNQVMNIYWSMHLCVLGGICTPDNRQWYRMVYPDTYSCLHCGLEWKCRHIFFSSLVAIISSRFSVAPDPSRCIILCPPLMCVMAGSCAMGTWWWARTVYTATYSCLHDVLDLQYSHRGCNISDARNYFCQVHCGFDQLMIKNAHMIIEKPILVTYILTVIFVWSIFNK